MISAEPRAVGWSPLSVGILATAGWIVAMAGAPYTGIYPPLIGLALALLWLTRGPLTEARRRRFDLNLRTFGLGLGLGLATVVVTHLAYGYVADHVPLVDREVRRLYTLAWSWPGRWAAVPFVVLIVAAEELVWRGVLLEALTSRYGQSKALLLSAASYGLAQLGSGSLVLGLFAFACGVAWGMQRVRFGMAAAFVTHLCWSLLVLVAFPVT